MLGNLASESRKPEGYMLAEDVLPYDVRGDVQKAAEDFRELRKKFLSKMPRPATSEEEKETERRRDAGYTEEDGRAAMEGTA